MRMVLLAWFLAGVVALLPGSAHGASERFSWLDSQHGWASFDAWVGAFERPSACGGELGYVCATEDGGQTWHGIFPRVGGLTVLLDRMSETAGVIASLDRSGGRYFWTRDAGRHWYQTTRVGPQFEGNSKYLFWSLQNKLYQVRPWPPRGSAASSCKQWLQTLCTKPQVVNAGMQSHVIARLDSGSFGTLVSIPGGVLATIRARTGPPQVLIRQGSIHRTANLPISSQGSSCYPINGYVDWPTVLLTGCESMVLWSTRDGGRSWVVHET